MQPINVFIVDRVGIILSADLIVKPIGDSMKIFAYIFVFVAWAIPGNPHRWAKKLMAERKVTRSFEKSLRQTRRV